jgi:hypothetical protein
MQFRTAAGGVEIGSVSIDAQGNINHSGFWPYGADNGSPPFMSDTFPSSSFQPDSSGTVLVHTGSGNDGTDYVFGTVNGLFAVDTQNGTVLGLPKASAKAFDPTVAGTYKAIFYQKNNASTGNGNVETGTPSLGKATLTIDAGAHVTISDSGGTTIVQATLTPVADAAYLVGAGELQDPCFGLFTFRVTGSTTQTDVFLTFQGRSVLFSSFTGSSQPGATYSYVYGVGVKGS